MIINNKSLIVGVSIVCSGEEYDKVLAFIDRFDETEGVEVVYDIGYIDEEMAKKINAEGPIYLFSIDFETSLADDFEEMEIFIKNITFQLELLCDSNKKNEQVEEEGDPRFKLYKGGKP